MSVYMTEEEQLAAIKQWWKSYGNWVSVLLSLTLCFLIGYRYWHWHQEKINTQASNTYEQLMIAYSNQDNKAAQGYANQLITKYTQSVYADSAQLVLAKLFVAASNHPNALKALESVANNSSRPVFKQIARLRIARLYLNEKKYDSALKQLEIVDDADYKPAIDEIKGDILTATGKYSEAKLAYQEAIKQERVLKIANPFLEMKINELAVLMQNKSVSGPKKLFN